MNTRSHHDGRLRAVRALLRVRELELRRAEGAYQKKQRTVLELERDVSRLDERCRRLTQAGGPDSLRRRRTLDAVVRTKLARTAELESARREASRLVPALYSARARRDAVLRLWSRRILDRDVAELRREEAATADLAAARVVFRKADASEY